MKFNTILNECHLHGTWRLCNPDNRDYTWSKRTSFVARRLDYIFFFNSGTVDKTTDCHNVRAPMSDHRGCLIHIKFTEVIEVVMDIGD